MINKRCAIYTRKSHAEGLEQDFNSLDAQREACESFISSQRHEGWIATKAHYDDGGFSGGNMDRPALKEIIADIEAGRINIVVVYKVDRLTRSLADFAKLIELFDKHEVSFVSVTQQFNTTSSMGRLTLNVLLSFAQFEREITGERIRDKFAASKKKGIWMGGHVPLGYDARDRQLFINVKEAKTVTLIFSKYLELKNVKNLKEYLDANNIRSKKKILRDGSPYGGVLFSRGGLYKILSNPIYIGEIKHKEKRYVGQHEAIISDDIWKETQNLLTENKQIAKQGLRAKEPSLLAGLLFDDKGNAMSPSHAVKNGKRYRYYTSQALIKQDHGKAGSLPRVTAAEIESCVLGIIRKHLLESDKLSNLSIFDDETVWQINQNIKSINGKLEDNVPLKEMITSVTITVKEVTLQLSKSGIEKVLGFPTQTSTDTISITESIKLESCKFGSKDIQFIGKSITENKIDSTLIKAISRAYVWNQKLLKQEAKSIRELARQENLDSSYISQIIPLAFLEPSVVDAIICGKITKEWTLKKLLNIEPLAWKI